MSSATSEPADPDSRTERIVIHGRVQGVGFRWWARHEAESLGISGTIRNREDGAVELQAHGPPPALDSLVQRLRVGPPTAHVERLLRQPGDTMTTNGFEIIR